MDRRWREKLGEHTRERPSGRLIWLHGVGLGEVIALRGLVNQLAGLAPDLQFLITSSTRASAEVIAANMPPRAAHQFLPFDAPRFLRRFLDHWRPDLVIWSEQDIWPGAIFANAERKIPQAFVNARMTARSFERRQRLAPLYRAALRRLALVDAQETGSATRLVALGARDVTVSGSLKPAGPPLHADPQELCALKDRLSGRRIWVAASTHPGDEREALAAMQVLTAPEWLLILVPREVSRAEHVEQALAASGLQSVRRSLGQFPDAATRVWLADTYGELGLWYRLGAVALVGGGFDAIGGHNPWEPAQLGAAILHGPDTRNFQGDYAQLAAAGATRELMPGQLADALRKHHENQCMATRARERVDRSGTHVRDLAVRLVGLLT